MTVVWALTWLGQSAVLAVLTAVCVRLPGCGQLAATRYVAWSVTLFLCAGLLVWPVVGEAATAPSLLSVPGAAGTQPAASIPPVTLSSEVTRLSWWLGWIWALGSSVGVTLAARDGWRVVRLKRRTEPLSTEDQARLGAGLAAHTSSRVPRLAWCDALDSPAVLGFSRPVIALPRSQVASLSEAHSRLIVLHELAHVRRRDDWGALGERLVLALAWVNPAVHWVVRELSLAREMACDEWVVRQTAAPVAYAKCLADVAGSRTRARRLPLAAGIAGRPSALRRRIVGVLALDGRPTARAAAVAAWLAPAAICVVGAGLLQLPPVFVVAHPPDAAVTAPARSPVTDIAAGVSAGRSSTRLDAAGQPAMERRASAARRSSRVSAIPVELAASLESGSPAPPTPEMAEQTGDTDLRPLSASPLPGSGGPGVAVAATVPETFPFQTGGAPWWSGPVAIGETTGGVAATAGRATASFFTGLGSHVPQLLKR
jgi:beta-lactamase regulating signal transducer with metallopeptidase domain